MCQPQNLRSPLAERFAAISNKTELSWGIKREGLLLNGSG